MKGLGESLADVGLAQLRLGNLSLAVKLLREGVGSLEGDNNPTFAIRAKKRLAQALLLSGHPIQALRELSAVHETALENQIYDQITASTDIAHRITSVIAVTPSMTGTARKLACGSQKHEGDDRLLGSTVGLSEPPIGTTTHSRRYRRRR